MSKAVRERAQNKASGIQTHMMDSERGTQNLISLDALFELLPAGKQKSKELHGQVVASLTRPFPTKIDPIQLFTVGRRIGATASYWALPAKESWIVGVDQATEIATEGPLRFRQAATALHDILRSAVVEAKSDPGPIFLGGFRFRSEPNSDAMWQEFHDGLLTLPRWMISSQPNDQRLLTLNVVLSEQTDVDSLRKELAAQALVLFAEHDISTEPAPATVSTEPMADGWDQKVQRALQAIKERKLSKVTLARTMRLQSETSIHPETVLRSLTANYPECRTFAFSRRGATFLGASPEELVSFDGESVTSTCLAGSAPRGESQSIDIELANWLLSNEKELMEHRVVVDWISERMGALCTNLHWSITPYVLRLGNVQHLATRFEGNPMSGSNVLDFVEALHPTPAVGGMPLGPALEMIQRLENFDRGWYTGPVGWVDGNGNGEFSIAIRCALLRGNEAILYAGDGIVAGSDPETEGHETAMKFNPLLTALGAL